MKLKSFDSFSHVLNPIYEILYTAVHNIFLINSLSVRFLGTHNIASEYLIYVCDHKFS